MALSAGSVSTHFKTYESSCKTKKIHIMTTMKISYKLNLIVSDNLKK